MHMCVCVTLAQVFRDARIAAYIGEGEPICFSFSMLSFTLPTGRLVWLLVLMFS